MPIHFQIMVLRAHLESDLQGRCLIDFLVHHRVTGHPHPNSHHIQDSSSLHLYSHHFSNKLIICNASIQFQEVNMKSVNGNKFEFIITNMQLPTCLLGYSRVLFIEYAYDIFLLQSKECHSVLKHFISRHLLNCQSRQPN